MRGESALDVMCGFKLSLNFLEFNAADNMGFKGMLCETKRSSSSFPNQSTDI